MQSCDLGYKSIAPPVFAFGSFNRVGPIAAVAASLTGMFADSSPHKTAFPHLRLAEYNIKMVKLIDHSIKNKIKMIASRYNSYNLN
jgi:hypothetical protein